MKIPLRVLTINLCTSWTTSRKSRMLQVRQFMEANEVDALLFQEGLQVCWPFYNSLRNLCPDGWWCYSKGYIGFPWFYSWRVGVLSRYEIVDMASLGCEVPQTELLDAIPYPGRKRVVSVTVEAPGLGRVSLISVHLVSSPKTPEDKKKELALLTKWKNALPPSDVTICGGDWNCFLDAPGSIPDYIVVEGNAQVVSVQQVLTGQVVTDHAGGVFMVVER